MSRGPELYVDRLIGRDVVSRHRERIGRIEELRADKEGDDIVVTGYVIGRAGLLERLGVGGRLVLGLEISGGYLARWDQIDVSDPLHPRLRCRCEDLTRL